MTLVSILFEQIYAFEHWLTFSLESNRNGVTNGATATAKMIKKFIIFVNFTFLLTLVESIELNIGVNWRFIYCYWTALIWFDWLVIYVVSNKNLAKQGNLDKFNMVIIVIFVHVSDFGLHSTKLSSSLYQFSRDRIQYVVWSDFY